MENSKLKFPNGFCWGAATASHQIEGNNTNSDWWKWENRKRDPANPDDKWPLEPSGIADDSYNRYEEDFDLCAKMNSNATRISIEWSRIEPIEGQFDQEQIEHYKNVLKAAKDRGLKTFVTLQHFTCPIWFEAKGSWVSFSSHQTFARYAKKCAEEFGDLIDVYLTINEPQVYIFMGYIKGIWYPGKKNIFLAPIVQFNLIRAHRAAYDAIKSVNKNYPVGIVKQMVWAEPSTKGIFPPIDKLWCRILTFIRGDSFLWPLGKKNDLIGVNHYFTEIVKNLSIINESRLVVDLKWSYLNGIGKTLLYLKKYNVPTYITENGMADAEDKYRKEFIRVMLKSVHWAIQNGADTRGYFHWSLLDNYEWSDGFWPRFGLVEIDRANNLERKPRPSFYYYGEICKNNALESN